MAGERIIITPEEVANVAQRLPSNEPEEKLSILLTESERSSRPWLLLGPLALIPFINAVVWHRHFRSARGPAGRWGLAAAALLGLLSMSIALWILLVLLFPSKGWLERINDAADGGVVIVETTSRNGTSTGSGFVAASRSNAHLIVTNKHVVGMGGSAPQWRGQSKACIITMRSGGKLEGSVAGWHRNPDIDLALIVTAGSGLKPLGVVGRFEGVKLGDDVVAVGHPGGLLRYSFGRGSVERMWEGLFLQTSVPINQGNSGGPLLDKNSRVIGVNTLVLSPKVGAPHAFAIRADLLLELDDWICSPAAQRLLEKVGH